MLLQSSSFRWRSFVTMITFVSFLALLFSGIALYLRPEGSLARWINWTFLGMDKKQWEAAHTGVVILFLASCLIHFWYNFRPLVSHLRSSASLVLASGSRLPLFKELAAALVVFAVLFFGAVRQWPPLSAVGQLRADLKNGKYNVRANPPIVDADKLSVADFCRAADLDTEQALRNARQSGVIVENPSLIIGKIAEENNRTPEEIFLALRGD
jgi:hypothetical protein